MALKVKRDPKTGIWQITGVFRGRRIRKSAETTERSTAEAQRVAIETAILNGTFGIHNHTFADAAEGYLMDEGSRRFLKAPLVELGRMELRQITPHMIRDAAKKAYPEASGATLNRQFITPAQAVINWGHQQGMCGPIRVKRFPVDKAERKAIGREWLDAFMAEASPHLGALYLFMFTTGARVSEAVRLTWSDVSLPNKTALLRDTKNGEDHTAHLTLELLDRMRMLPISPRIFLFKSRHSVYGPAQNACKRAGIEYVPPHQAGRHSFATALDSAGMTAKQIADAGGWKSPRLVQDTYMHPDKPGKLAAEIMEKKK